jgi:transposase
MQEFEHLSIREAAIKVRLSKSTAARKIKEWNEMTNDSDQGGVPDTISPKEHKGRRLILKDVHTVFIFEMLANEPTLTVEAVTDQLCKNFKEIQITPRSVATHMKKRCRLTYKRIVPQYFARDSEETAVKRYDTVNFWIHQKIDFMNDCVFIDEAGFNRNMHRSYGWCEVGTPCKIKVETRGPNVSILGAISKDGLITLSRKEIITTAAAGKRQRTDDTPAVKRKGTTSNDFLEFIEQVLTTIDAAGMNYKYLVLDNASIHKANLVRDWVEQRGYQLLFLPPYSPFLNPIEEFWSKLKNVVNNDPASVRQSTKISERIRNASVYISKEDCESWIRHSLSFWQRCIDCEKGL